jgi:hypothetical protein
MQRWYDKPKPSPVYTRGSTGLGMSERAFTSY